jgi:hypothetical protein
MARSKMLIGPCASSAGCFNMKGSKVGTANAVPVGTEASPLNCVVDSEVGIGEGSVVSPRVRGHMAGRTYIYFGVGHSRAHY